MRRSTRLSALLAASAVVLAACGSGSTDAAGTAGPSASASGSASRVAGPQAATKVGVKVTGEVGKKPSLEIPSSAAPTTTSIEVLEAGDGATVAKGDVLVADYLGQTWAPKDGKVNVFDNSYDRGQPAGFPIGVGAVVKGWDSTLVGQKVGSRVLLSITPADGYGATASAQNALGGQTLVFVVDLKRTIKGDAVATGTAVSKVPAGFPAVKSASGKRPEITSIKGVKPTAKPTSTLLLRGTGDPIVADKQLVLQYLQTDVATGKQTQRTWEAQQPQVVPAKSVLSLVTVLKDQPVGSRAVVVTAQEASSPAQILVIDVIGQF
jgi:peptidylprolyl isomerase